MHRFHQADKSFIGGKVGKCLIITLCNLAGSDSADVQVLLQVVRLLPQQLLVVPPGFDPLFPREEEYCLTTKVL